MISTGPHGHNPRQAPNGSGPGYPCSEHGEAHILATLAVAKGEVPATRACESRESPEPIR